MGQDGWLGCRDADRRGQNVLVAICPGPPFLCAYAEPHPRTPLATFWGEDSDPVLVSKPRGRSMSHQMRAKLQRCVERVHGAKDEDDAPWTNLFTVSGLAPNHPVGRRTRKAGAPFLCLKSRTAPVPEGTGGPQILFQSLRTSRFEAAVRACQGEMVYH